MEINFDTERLFYNKWEMHKLLSTKKLHCNVPFTMEFSERSLLVFSNKKCSFFIKPIDSWGGNFITIVEFVRNRYLVKRQGLFTRSFLNKERLVQFILANYKRKHCIIQEKAPIVSYFSRPFDIRVHLQRDEKNKWVYAGDLIRIGGNNSVVSNFFISNGKVVETRPLLNKLFRSEEKVNQIIALLEKSSFKIAELLDKHHTFIDIGCDFGVDKDGELWLFEVNTDDLNGRPYYELFKELPNNIYNDMKKRDERRNNEWLLDALEGYISDK